MDPEPGRCRRTDGNKWRCRKDVVPDTKYCERHMHRGRSRKHVETSKVTLLHNTPKIMYSSSKTSKNISQKIKSHDPDETSAKFPTPVPENQQTKIPSLDESKGLSCTATALITSSANGKSKSKITNEFVENDISSSVNVISRENNDNRNGVDTGSGNMRDKNNKGNSTNGDKNGGPVTPELSISGKSGVNVVTICKQGDAIAEEPQRCRRTDGKRWRCSKEAVPQQKYCGSHMHRGSKRCKSSSEVETVTATAAVLDKLKGDSSTDLSISRPKCTQPTAINLDSSTSGSSSNAATVTDTDENTSASHILSSP